MTADDNSDLYEVSVRVQLLCDEKPHRSWFLREKTKWDKLWASLYQIGDTELAIGAYEAAKDVEDGSGEAYLITFGLLQAMVVQQDALVELCAIVDLPYKLDKALLHIRHVRNGTIGHPVEHSTGGRGTAVSCLVRASLHHGHVTVARDYRNPDEYKHEDVDLIQLIQKQRHVVREKLLEIEKHLQNTR
ncbi:MAG: hypothetical protein KBG84_06165 [Planctomycetes bacterium]|nr:hypothetical protein [Planctomycetota bacterium]